MRKPEFASVSRMHDMHRLALLIRPCARSFFKASYSMQCCPAKALTWMTLIITRIRICQRITKTTARLLTCHGKISKANVSVRHFFLKDNVVGEKANSTVDFKVISFEKFTVWEIAARSLDFSSVAVENLCC